MKITVNIDTYHPAAAIGLKWQMPSAPKDDGPIPHTFDNSYGIHT
jgi:hypothetical protein